MKFKKRQQKICFTDNWDFIATKNVINKKENKITFYKKAKEYILDKSIDFSSELNIRKIDRLLNLLKWTNVFIDDKGKIINKDYIFLLKKLILRNDLIKSQRGKIKQFIVEVRLLQEVKRKLDRNFFTKIKDIVLKSTVDFKYLDYETNCKYMSDYLHQHNKNLTLNKLNKIKYRKRFINEQNYYLIVELWKYGNARISKKDKYIEVDAFTEELKCYLATIQINSAVRQLNYGVHFSNIKDLDKYALQGIASIFYLKVKPSFYDYDKDEQEILYRYFKQKLYGVDIGKWLKYLFYLIIKMGKIFAEKKPKSYFATLIDEDVSFISKNERDIIIEKLTFNIDSDLLDRPFINGKFIFWPSLLHIDPVYIVSKLMRESSKKVTLNDKKIKWQDLIGDQYEKYYYSLLDNNNYVCQHTLYKKNGEETDLLFLDKDDIPVLTECKSFMNPHSLKDYINQLDKMYSNGYIIKDTKHIAYFRNLGINNSDDSVYEPRLRNLCNWKKSYGIFLANIIFPFSYIQKWKNYSDLYFIYDIDFYKTVSCTKMVDKKITWEFDPNRETVLMIICSLINDLNLKRTGINKYNICRLETVQPSLKLELNENRNFPLSKYVESVNGECIRINNIILKRYI